MVRRDLSYVVRSNLDLCVIRSFDGLSTLTKPLARSKDVRPKCITPLLDFRVTQQFLRFFQKRLDAFLFHLSRLEVKFN